MNKKIGLYIHIPFCISKCSYCDFTSFACNEKFLTEGFEKKLEEYFEALDQEISLYEKRVDEYFVSTVYIGGGTPSIVPPHLIENLVKKLCISFNLSKVAEFTIEANPGTLNAQKLNIYRGLGINRLSIGLQACQDELLVKLGRIHDYKTFENNFLEARKQGFDNISIDLMLGLPEQGIDELMQSVRMVLDLEPEHISCYSLKVEEGTSFYEQQQQGLLILPSDDLERQMYYTLTDMLEGKAYEHYEISNYSRKGFESKHNLMYWNCGEYIGLGLSAHSYFESTRYSNTSSFNEYINGKYSCNDLTLIDNNEKMNEFMLLGLRLLKGVNRSEFIRTFDKSIDQVFYQKISVLKNYGLLIDDGESIRLTKRGLDVANLVFSEFI